MVSLDFIDEKTVHRTLRLDFDGAAIRGGWSPANLNWDAELRATHADIDTALPDGIEVAAGTVEALAEAARTWFQRHVATRDARGARRG